MRAPHLFLGPTRRHAASRGALFLGLILAAACSRAPSEPEPEAKTTAPSTGVKALSFAPPGTWNQVDSSTSGEKRATYKVPKVGGDKEDAELTVWFYGTGSGGDAAPHVDEWLRFFQGDPQKDSRRETVTVDGRTIDFAETAGKYKMPVGPPIGPNKKTPMQIVKEDFRMLVGVVHTAEQGNWFFRVIGPNDTVESARDAFQTMVREAR